MVKTCPICKYQYNTDNPRQKLCSDECRQMRVKVSCRKYYEKTHPSAAEMKKCSMCGKLFIPHIGGIKMCETCHADSKAGKLSPHRKKKEESKPKVESLISVNAKAKALGMTYGQYMVAKQLGKVV